MNAFLLIRNFLLQGTYKPNQFNWDKPTYFSPFLFAFLLTQILSTILWISLSVKAANIKKKKIINLKRVSTPQNETEADFAPSLQVELWVHGGAISVRILNKIPGSQNLCLFLQQMAFHKEKIRESERERKNEKNRSCSRTELKKRRTWQSNDVIALTWLQMWLSKPLITEQCVRPLSPYRIAIDIKRKLCWQAEKTRPYRNFK